MIRRRRTFVWLGLLALVIAVGLYARFIESEQLELRRVFVDVDLPNADRPIRILQLSDLHWSKAVSIDLIARAVAMGMAERPDLVCLTGDYITVTERLPREQLARVLKPLSETAPGFAIFGNHDGGRWADRHGGSNGQATREMLVQAGFTPLLNEAVVIDVHGVRIAIAGAADAWAGGFDAQKLGRALEPLQADLTLLLAHNPDSKELYGDLHWDVMLSGHTHGGQFVIPLIGAPIVPVRDRRYVAGLNRWSDRWIYTTRGVGSLLGLRLNCRPEVTLLEIG